MRILQLLAHSIEEYDQVLLWSRLGHEIFSPGAYVDPAHPMDDKRPALPDVPMIPEMKAVVDRLGQPGHPRHGRCDGTDPHPDPLMAAKNDFPDEMIEWAEVIICHHLEHTWIVPQWDRIRHKRVIWRTVGQSAHPNEWLMRPLRKDGLQIVRYSPKEANIPEFAGIDALIRFYKDPDEWSGWTGAEPVVTNVTQDLYKRSLADDQRLQNPGFQFTSFGFWQDATAGLAVRPAGPGSQEWGGLGSLPMEAMKDLLRTSRVYLYTGTQPASYTLGLIEAMMIGIPVISIGPEWFRIMPYGPALFEGHEIATSWTNNPRQAAGMLRTLLADHDLAARASVDTRQKAINLFGRATIEAQWAAFIEGRE